MKRTIYLMRSGKISRKNKTICIESKQLKTYMPIKGISDIMVFGEVQLNKAFLGFCTQNEITIHFFTRYGTYLGSYYAERQSNDANVLLAQAGHAIDASKQIWIAQAIVTASARNILRVMLYYQYRGIELRESIDQIRTWIQQVQQTQTTAELMAIEANIRQKYYAEFDAIINDPNFEFQYRSKRPPHNAINACISFGNSLLYTLVLSTIHQTKLDPRIGYLHANNARPFTLNLDLAELFKPILVDRTIFTLIHRKQLTANDFETLRGGGVYLNDTGKATFLKEWDTRLRSTFEYKPGKWISYRMAIREECYQLQKHIMDEKIYEPFLAKW